LMSGQRVLPTLPLIHVLTVCTPLIVKFRQCSFLFIVATAVEHCHLHGVSHRDLKPDNILLDSNFNIKVADFGLSAINGDTSALLQTACGTMAYMAPEILRKTPYVGLQTDIVR
jgi:serine/threonine protein kinase